MILLLGQAFAATCFDAPTYVVHGERVVVGFESVLVSYDHAQIWVERVDGALDALEAAGWLLPPGLDEHDLLVLLEDQGDADIAWAACPDGTEMPVFTFPDEDPLADALAVRSLHLALQARYDDQPEWVQTASAEVVAYTLTGETAWLEPVESAVPVGQGAGEARFLKHVDDAVGLRGVWEGDDLDTAALWASWLPTLFEDSDLPAPTADGATSRLPAETAGQALPRLDALAFASFQVLPGAGGSDHDDARFHLDVDPDAEFVAWLVADPGGSWTSTPFSFDNGEATLVFEGLSRTQDGVFVVLGPTAGEDALWLLTVTGQGDPPPDADEPGSDSTRQAFRSGCSTASGAGWLLGALVLLRRQRFRANQTSSDG